MKKLLLAVLLLAVTRTTLGVSMGFGGAFRTEAAYYSRIGLGLAGAAPDKSLVSARALLNPSLIIDDHFSLKSQWNLLTSPTFTPSATVPLGPGQGSYIFGDTSSAALVLSRAWLEWTSDVGVMRIGRMPFAWGYGLVWDEGNALWDDFQTTIDRLEYRLFLGHVVGGVAYSKGRKGSLIGEANDSGFYTVYLHYDNPESEVQAGILYESQHRSPAQAAELVKTVAGKAPNNPYFSPGATYPLSTLGSPYPLSNHVVDLFFKKTVGELAFGGEIGWTSGTAAHFDGGGARDDMNAFGAMTNVTFERHGFRGYLDFLFASGDSNLADNKLTGFVLLNRNRRAGLILGRELLGAYAGETAHQGSCVVYGNAGTFSGCIFLRPGVRVEWTPTLATSLELIWGRKAAAAAGESSDLGVESDLGMDYAVYQNATLGVNLAYLFPGRGLQAPSPKGVFAFRSTFAVRF